MMKLENLKPVTGYVVNAKDKYENIPKHYEQICDAIKKQNKDIDLGKAEYIFQCQEMFYNPKAETHKYRIMVAPDMASLPEIEGLKIATIKGGEYATLLHKGPYNQIGEKYKQLTAEIKEAKLSIAGFPFELYLNDPAKVEESELETLIAFPVRKGGMLKPLLLGGSLILVAVVAFKMME